MRSKPQETTYLVTFPEEILNKKLHLLCSAKHQLHRMVKHGQATRRLLLANCLSMFDHFWGLSLRMLSS